MASIIWKHVLAKPLKRSLNALRLGLPIPILTSQALQMLFVRKEPHNKELKLSPALSPKNKKNFESQYYQSF
jgi:hypothetical protein